MQVNQILFVGHNKYGQAGIGQKYHNKTFISPKSYNYPIFIKQLSCGSHYSALLTIDGNIYTMGSNIHGALGSNPNLNYSFVPTLVQQLNEVTKIDCGPFHMCAISNGQLYSWGKGIDGQLGQGNTKNLSKPTKVQPLKNVEDVSCGANHTLVLINGQKQNQRICYSFGNGIYGHLGSGQTRNSYNPVKVNLSNIEFISAGQNHSLFLSGGKVYSCGDNSHGQLGTNCNKKFVAQPTLVQLPIDHSYQVKSVQAKKFSAALTDTGEVYVWGYKNFSGFPKAISGSSSSQIIQIRLGNQNLYGLSSKGILYAWNLNKIKSTQGNTIQCQIQTILSNDNAILDFSIGQNYLMIMGDIIKQVPYMKQLPLTLQYDQYETNQSNQSSSQSKMFDQSQNQSQCSGNSGQIFIDSQFLQSHKDGCFNNLMMNSSKINRLFNGSNPIPSNISEQIMKNSKFSKIKRLSQMQPMNNHNENHNMELSQIRDFNNAGNHHQQKNVHNENNQSSQIYKGSDPFGLKAQKKLASDYDFNHNDTYELVKTPSNSSIFGQPHNFLKESMNQITLNEQIKRNTLQSAVQNETGLRQMTFNNVNLRKKKYTYNYIENNKQNLPDLKPLTKKEDKKKKLDKIIQMLQKSNSINTKNNLRENIKIDDAQFQNESEIIQSNRILRVQLRQKQIKISNLQQLLSRKQMEIQAQRQLIKALRDKNNSNYASLQQNAR